MSGHAWLRALDLVGRVIEVGPDSTKDDTTWDPGMRALVLWITEDTPDVWIARMDFRPFMATNIPLMVPDFHDRLNQPVLTALDAHSWLPIADWYLPAPGSDWDQRLLPGPRWRHSHPIQHTHKGQPRASVFDGLLPYHRWKEIGAVDLDAVRAMADAAGFLGGNQRRPDTRDHHMMPTMPD